MRPLVVAAGKRLSALPDVPTAAEAGFKDYASAAWFAFVAPRGPARPVVDKLYREVAAAMSDTAVRTRLIDFGAEPLAITPEELGKFISSEIIKWREIITKGGITIDP